MKSLLFISLLLMGVQSETPMKDEAAFIKKFEEISEATTSIQCDFEQKKHLSFSKEPLITKGSMLYEKGNMRWEQVSPKPYLMIITDDVLKIKENGEITEHGLEENKYMKGLKEIMVGSMTGTLLNSDHFNTSFFENPALWIVKLTPKKARLRKMFSEVIMNFNKETYRMDNVVLREENGDYTVINFINPVFNETISAAKFEMK